MVLLYRHWYCFLLKEDVRSKSICISRLNFSCGRPGRRWPRCGCRCASWRPRRRGARLRLRQRGGSTGRGWRGWMPPSRRTSRPAWGYGSPIQIFFTFFIKYFSGQCMAPQLVLFTSRLLAVSWSWKCFSGAMKFESLVFSINRFQNIFILLWTWDEIKINN